MNIVKKVIILLFLFFSIGQSAYAKTYQIEEVQIRAWIQPDGNVLVNEKFTYTFEGEYKSLRRSIHGENHEGVEWFEAYELLNEEGEIGFLEEGDLRSLPVKQEGNTYRSPFNVENSTKSVIYAYELTNAVKSYDTYSDVTIPFFGTGDNHDVDLHNVTIDFVFPEEIDPDDYSAFFHAREGTVEEKGSSLIRFTSPVSKMYSLTETRLLFPSSIMKEQEKSVAPKPLHKVIAEEETRLEEAALKETQMESYNKVLIGMAVLLGLITLIVIFGYSIGRIRGRNRISDVLVADPLLLYMIHTRGKFTHMAFMAGLYSLVESGKATVRKEKTTSRFLSDPKAPDETLFVHLTAEEEKLSEMEKKFVSRFFKRKGRNGSASLALTDLAGATKGEKDNRRHLKSYHEKVKTLKTNEKEWFDEVLKEARAAKLLHGSWFHMLAKMLPILTLTAISLAFYFDQQSSLAISLYAGGGLAFLVFAWVKLKKRNWSFIAFYFLSIFAAAQVYHETTLLLLLASITLSALLLLLVPRYVLPGRALGLKEGIRRFKKQVRKDRNPDVGERDLDKWMIRSMMFHSRRRVKTIWQNERTEGALLSTAPLTALVLSNQNPHEFLTNSWKWSVPPAIPSSGSYDGGYYGGGGGGGDGGGGAGAD
ncbi:DUF2207 domain-containing protein [Bacillus sp. Marseille-Q1617]|uniref:DUF2207 domain-containing protein n=1 Tax=Bacillus sp. Marseille-Q1617 TaxID=2736887 RepID=UPI00158879A4|nr:DUF2207 domain-containing protein [Bacillus sp. Marseille-Q1617]